MNSYNSSRDSKKQKTSSHSNNSQQQQGNKKPTGQTTTVTELPETFGLPSNSKKPNNFQQEILIDDQMQPNQVLSSSEEIEVISENYPENPSN